MIGFCSKDGRPRASHAPRKPRASVLPNLCRECPTRPPINAIPSARGAFAERVASSTTERQRST